MPELPEVETVVKQLKEKVLGKTISRIEILVPKMVDPHLKTIVPVKIKAIFRRAKSLIFELERNQFLLVHLRMDGHFHYASKENLSKLALSEKYLVAKFYFTDGSILTHHSVRMFGYLKLLNQEQLRRELAQLGPEPLAEEFTIEKFAEILHKKKKANIKATLMDQKVLAGVGNIYAQEALYFAHLNPRRTIETLSPGEIGQLYREIKRILQLAIKHNGTTVDSFTHLEGSGGFQGYLAVYQKKQCPEKHIITKIILSGRGTYYCSHCQR